MPRSAAEIEFRKKQAVWFLSCSRSHQLFCNCGDWTAHIKKILWPGTIQNTVLNPIGKSHVVDGFIVGGGGDGFPIGDVGTPEEITEKFGKGLVLFVLSMYGVGNLAVLMALISQILKTKTIL